VVADAAMLLLNRKLSPDVQVSSVPEPVSEPQPVVFRLANYPNPFNAQTIIRFELTRSAAIQLKIFNLVGQELETLLQVLLAPGVYEVPVPANQWASGIYFYELQAGHQKLQRKMLLLR